MAYALARDVPITENDVAVCMTHGLFGSHLGVAFQDERGKARLVHLANHQRMRIEDYPVENWVAKVVPFDPLESMQLLPFLRAYTEKLDLRGSNDIEYGISVIAGRGAFDAEWNYRPERGANGFTCATMINEFFHEPGFPLLDASGWPKSAANAIWGDSVVCMLRAGGEASADHIAAVQRTNSGQRITPEEVAAAADQPRESRPVDYATASLGAPAAMAAMLSMCGPPTPIPYNNPYAQCVRHYAQTGKPCAPILPAPALPALNIVPPLVRAVAQPARRGVKVGRNDHCGCQSGKKFKHCCGK